MSQRGSYFRYLRDHSLSVPYTTDRSRATRNVIDGDGDNRVPYDNGVVGDEVFNHENNHRDLINYDDEENENVGDNCSSACSELENSDRASVASSSSSQSDSNESFEEVERNINYQPQDHGDVRVDDHVEVHGDVEMEERIPIYPGAPLTKDESDHLIMSFLIRHHLTDVALQDLLELINCHLPVNINSSKYTFLKNFTKIPSVTSFYLCPFCTARIDITQKRGDVTCISCQRSSSVFSLKRKGADFVSVSIREQLSTMFSSPLFHKLRLDFEETCDLSDISSGIFHKRLREKGKMSGVYLTAQVNLDGVQIFKSSMMSMCPIQMTINELDYKTRKENVILAGLWASKRSPDMDIFLEPFIDECIDLHHNGFECFPPGFREPIIVKVHTILASTDAVERCKLQNIHQFNGEFGCPTCFNKGEMVPVGNGHARIYKGDIITSRTHKQHIKDAMKAQEEKEVIRGVKGVSMFMLLALFHMIRSFPPEYLHSILIGAVKLFFSSWIDSKNHLERWYLGNRVQAIDAKLLSVKPPCEISRPPQSISNLSKWKASEFKHFLLYYSLPCLKEFMIPTFYKHWSLLVYSVYIFDGDRITPEAFKKASEAMKEFVLSTERLYGQEFMKFNVHSLLHIPKAVQDFGALWGWSAFPYESYNFVLRNMVHNSQAVVQQISKSYLRYLSIKYLQTFSKVNCSNEGKNLYLRMLHKYRMRTGHQTIADNHLVIYRHSRIIEMTMIEQLAIQALLEENIRTTAVSYARFHYGNVLYHSTDYTKIWKRNNCVVKTSFETFVEISGLVCVSTVADNEKYVILGKQFQQLDEFLPVHNLASDFVQLAVVRTNNIVAFFPHQIKKKCVLVPVNNTELYVIELVNSVETD